MKKYEILIVDDVSENIKVAISILRGEKYNFSYALDGREAIKVLQKKRFDLILLDVMMPNIDGFELCKIIKNSPAIQDTPIIFVTAKVDIESIEEGFKIGGVDYVTKPFHPTELRSRVANHIELYEHRKRLNRDNKELSKEIDTIKSKHYTDLEIAQKEIIYILSEIMESDSGETAYHVKRVATISKQFALLDARVSDDEAEILFLAAPLHDIGKILVDNSILHKSGKLTDEEFSVMKKHPFHAMNILKKSEQELIKSARTIAYEHHENYDGSGYPRGLKAKEIHIYGRIVAIADVLDALTHKRSYKEAWSFKRAAEHVIGLSGRKFDPVLVDIFKNNLALFKNILEK